MTMKKTRCQVRCGARRSDNHMRIYRKHKFQRSHHALQPPSLLPAKSTNEFPECQQLNIFILQIKISQLWVYQTQTLQVQVSILFIPFCRNMEYSSKQNKTNIMAADALILCFARPSAAMILTKKDRWVTCFPWGRLSATHFISKCRKMLHTCTSFCGSS